MVDFLSKTRFGPQSNIQFKMSADDFAAMIDLGSDAFIQKVGDFIATFQTEQLPRLKELKRYYLADKTSSIGRQTVIAIAQTIALQVIGLSTSRCSCKGTC